MHGMVHLAKSLITHLGSRRYDENSYDRGHFQSIKTAKIKNGWKVVKNWQGTGKGRVRKHDVGIDYMEALKPGAELTAEFLRYCDWTSHGGRPRCWDH